MNIAIVGSGIAGITTAYYLAKNGCNVTVYEREYYPAMQCSFANGGQISVSNSEVWTTWSNVIKGVKWMFKKDAPLLIRPNLDLQKIIWLSKFLYNTATNSYERNTLQTIHMGLKSRALYNDIISKENIIFDQLNHGILHIYKNQKYFNSAIEAKKIYDKGGCEWEILSTTDIKNLDSQLHYFKNIIGGVYTKTDFTGDIHKFCHNLANILNVKYKVKFEYCENINDINDLLISHNKVVICAGSESTKLAKSIKDKLDIYPVKGYSITINSDRVGIVNSLPKISILDDEAKIVCSTLGSRFRVAGTAELNGYNYDIVKDRINLLFKWTHENFPMINTSSYSSFACLRPMTTNLLPITKQSDNNKRVYYNTGHGHLGWTTAPYTAKLITDIICDT